MIAAGAWRHDLAKLRQQLSSARHDLSAERATQLQEANQRLVLAALQADHIAEKALTVLAVLTRTYRHDALTGAINRAPMLDRVQQALLMARREQRRLALVFVDLDDFKLINDCLGHAVCRYGGDEFLVLLAEISAPADAGRIAASMLAALSAPVSVGGQVLQLSASLGISIYPDDGEDMTTLINRADSAMYRRKRDGLGDPRFQDEAWYQAQSRVAQVPPPPACAGSRGGIFAAGTAAGFARSQRATRVGGLARTASRARRDRSTAPAGALHGDGCP